MTGTPFNPHAKLIVEEVDDFEAFLKDASYRPAPFVPISDEERVKFRRYMDRLRKSVEDEKRGLITRAIYLHERTLVVACKDWGEDVVAMTPDDALNRATEAWTRRLEDEWLQIATSLEARQSYKYRLF